MSCPVTFTFCDLAANCVARRRLEGWGLCDDEREAVVRRAQASSGSSDNSAATRNDSRLVSCHVSGHRGAFQKACHKLKSALVCTHERRASKGSAALKRPLCPSGKSEGAQAKEATTCD